MQVKNEKPKAESEQGQQVKKEFPIHHSNVMHYSKDKQVRSRVGHKMDEASGKKVGGAARGAASPGGERAARGRGGGADGGRRPTGSAQQRALCRLQPSLGCGTDRRRPPPLASVPQVRFLVKTGEVLP